MPRCQKEKAVNRNKSTPPSLKALAAVLILIGLSAAIDIVLALLQGRVSLNIGVIGFIGFGLLALRPWCRDYALTWTWVTMLGVPLVVAYNLVFLNAPSAGEFVVAGVLFAVALWAHWILRRPDVRALFGH